MRRSLLLLLAGLWLAVGSFSCSGGVDTKTPPPGDDDDAGTTGTSTATPTPTATPDPSGLQGDPWTATATPAEDFCALGTITVPFGNAGVAAMGIGATNGVLIFDIGLNNPAIGIGDAPTGTVDMAGNFTQRFSYCTYDGLSTYKYYGNWNGTFAGDGLTFDSTLGERIFISTGADLRATCAAAINTAGGFNFGDCSSPGTIQFAVHGVKQ